MHAFHFNENRSPAPGKFRLYFASMQHSHLLFIFAFRFVQNSVSEHRYKSRRYKSNIFLLFRSQSANSLFYGSHKGNLYVKKKRNAHKSCHDLVKTRCVIMEEINRDRNRFGFRKLAPWLSHPRTCVWTGAFPCVQVVEWSNFYWYPPNDQFSCPFVCFLLSCKSINPLITHTYLHVNLKSVCLRSSCV